MLLGSLFLLAYASSLAELINLGSQWATDSGIAKRVRRLTIGTWVMAVTAWLTVITGTYIVYPWYRAPSAGRRYKDVSQGSFGFQSYYGRLAQLWDGVEGTRGLAGAHSGHRGGLHGDEYGARLAKDEQVRRAVIVLFTLAFFTAAVAGLFGAFINKAAPVL